MATKWILLLVVIGHFNYGVAQNNPKYEVQKSMNLQQKAWNDFNIEGFMDCYWKNDSLMFIGSKGITYGWKQTMENYKKNYNSKELMGQLTFTNYSIEVMSDSAVYVIGKWELKRDKKDVGGHYTLLWKRINNKWVITRDHTS